MKTAYRSVLALLAFAAVPAHAEECKPIQADLVEVFSTEGCNPGLTYCFLGVVDGNHGLRGTTHFRGNSTGTAPSGAPDALPYAGPLNTAPPAATC